MPLTSRREELFDYIIRTDPYGNTNIGDGIKSAAQLLMHELGHNQKFIVLITDGQPTAFSEKAFRELQPTREKDLTEESAIAETRKAASGGVRTSVIHITEGKEAGKDFVRKLARIGKGQVQRISSLEDIRTVMRSGARARRLLN